jgi:predicted cobalt transporter CbtA
MIPFTPRAGSVRTALIAGAVTFAIYVSVKTVLRKEIDWREAKLWGVAGAASMYFLGI